VLEYLSKIPNVGSKTYGRQRMWGTFGYLSANMLIEKSIRREVKGEDKDYDWEPLKLYQVMTTLLSGIASFFLINPGARGTQRAGRDIRSGWRELVTSPSYLFFIFIIFLNGVTRAAMTMYLTSYLKDILRLKGYPIPDNWPSVLKWIVGIFNNNPVSTTTMFGVSLEIVILYNSQYITSRFGLYWPLLFAQISQLLRFLFYYGMGYENPHAFIMVSVFELMKGLNFGFAHTSGVQLATTLCPAHLKATSQMIYQSTFIGLASMVAGFIFGSIFNEKKMKSKTSSIGDKVPMFKMFFFVNIIINSFSIAMFVWKYGLKDGKLSLDPFRRRREGEMEMSMGGTSKKRSEDIEEEVKVEGK
jgi:hypothetical protein